MDYKQLRRSMGATGWMMVIYRILMSASVFVAVFTEMIIRMIGVAYTGEFSYEAIYSMAMSCASSGWGYLLAIAVGIIILLCWKKRQYWKEVIWAKGKPMKAGAFFGILMIFLSTQLISQIFLIALEFVLNAMGLTMMESLESMAMVDTDNLSMFLYACILGPIAEELLCRGLVQRSLMPYGKKLAIVGSAFLFGMMHGNIYQAPFAFLVGLVLGYVAAEYSIAWAMLLHMINNMVIADMLTRLTSGMTEMAATVLIYTILVVFAVAAVVTLIRKRREIRAWMYSHTATPGYFRCFFSSGGVITFTVLTTLSIILMFVMMITPM